jgi:GDP/UDP-N,N'-diacetylbacillosamine 2-epimerase (hydrolysing)
MKRKICVITGSRAEYGLLHWVMRYIKDDPDLTLQLVVTGTHLSPEFGMTYQEIEIDGFQIDRKLEILLSSDTSVGISKSMGLGMMAFADAFSELNPDVVLVLGDRFEIFAAATAALVARIPIAHLHGGEVTEGAIDEAFRHSITKMSQIHFVAADVYRNRVIQLGENPSNVFLVGGLGIDNVKKLKLLDRDELEASLGFAFDKKNLLITFHPATLDHVKAESQMRELLSALVELKNTRLIFTLPNSDSEGRSIIKLLEDFNAKHPKNTSIHSSLGYLRYLSCVAQVDGVVGNSSSGLIEVPSFNKGTINIGDRQKGRLVSASVINCEPEKRSICQALSRLYSAEFQNELSCAVNLYGSGGASQKVVDILKSLPLKNIVKKKFHDL